MVLVASAARSTAERKPLLGFLIFLSDISMSTPIRPRAPPTHRNHGPFHLASDRKHARPIARILVYPVQVNRAFDRPTDSDELDQEYSSRCGAGDRQCVAGLNADHRLVHGGRYRWTDGHGLDQGR